MADLILSGGEFGGEIIENFDFAQTEISKTDEAGNVWVYDTTLSKNKTQADLKQFIPFDEVK